MILNYNKVLEDNELMESPRLILRPFNLRDAEFVFQYATDPLVTKFLTWDTITTIEMAENIIENIYMKRKVNRVETCH